MNLWCDDLRDPYDFVVNPVEWHWAKNNTQAIRALALLDWEIVSLDHDICHPSPEPDEIGTACVETFEATARYIALMSKRPIILFHTANPAGENIMRDILKMGPK